MKPSALWREAWRDIATGTAGSLALALLLTLICYGLLGIDLLTISRLNDEAARYQSSMASVRVVAAPEHIDPLACAALNTIPDVRAAAAVRTSKTGIRALALPGTTITAYDSVGPIERVLHADSTSQTPGIIIAQQVAETLGLTAGDGLALEHGDTTVRAVFPWNEHDGRRSGYAYSAFIPAPTSGAFDECWIDMWPINEEVISQALTAVIPSGSRDPVQVERYSLNASAASRFDGPQRYSDRATRYGAATAIGAAAVLGALNAWRRRLEIASDLHAGVTRTDMTLKLLMETALPAVASPFIASPLIVWIITANAAQDRGAMRMLAGTTTIGIACAVLAGALAASALIRERRLFIYYKRR